MSAEEIKALNQKHFEYISSISSQIFQLYTMAIRESNRKGEMLKDMERIECGPIPKFLLTDGREKDRASAEGLMDVLMVLDRYMKDLKKLIDGWSRGGDVGAVGVFSCEGYGGRGFCLGLLMIDVAFLLV